MNSVEINKSYFHALFGHAPVIAALITFFGLLLAVITEWGYFTVIGPEFQVFESASDYLANAVLYLPQNLIVFSISLFLTFTLDPFSKHWRAADKGADEMPLSAVLVYTILAFFILLLAVPYLVFLFGYIDAATSRTLTLLLIFLYALSFLRAKYGILSGVIDLRISIAILILTFSSFVVGMLLAHNDLRSAKSIFFIEAGLQRRPVTLLRAFDKGVLVRSSVENTVEFVKWDQFSKLSLRKFTPDGAIPMCRIFGRLCQEHHAP